MVLKKKKAKKPADEGAPAPSDAQSGGGGAAAGRKPRRDVGEGRDGKKSWRSERKAKRDDEETEIQNLEDRIAAEAPAAGRTGFTASKGSKAKVQTASGPELTSHFFSDLPLSQRTQWGLQAGQFKHMTEIQRGAIPRALAGRDILGEARTGSGKTLAFLVPLLELLFRRSWNPMDGLGGLVVSPTRELAYQIFKVLSSVGQEHEFSAGCIVGGRSMQDEQKGIIKMSILVATPGRLLQHLDESPGFDVSGLLMLIFDEADRILDFGFQETVQHILGHLPDERQTLLFSATLRASVQRLSRAALRSPEVVSVHQDAKSQTPEKLQQVYMVLPLEQKVNFLFSFLRTHSQKKIIVFVSSCKQVRFLYEAFRKLKPGPAVMELHGRQSLTKRLIVFQEYTEKEHAVALFCTDIAARGVDFPAVDWVVQMDCPDAVDSYIHRVGRTARYQSSGHSALFVLPSEQAFVEKLAKARIDVKCISPKQGKLQDIHQQLMALLAGDGAIKHLAQKAFTSYIRSVMLLKDKEVFDAQALPRDEFAQSLGLVDAPDMGDLGGQVDVDKNPQKKMKNQTALQRLRDKIKQKRKDREHGAEGQVPAGGKQEETDEEEEMEQDKAKKLGRWERRQRRIQRASAAAPGADPGADGAAGEVEEDDLLQFVEDSRPEPKPAAPTAAKQQRMKLRDGKAVGAKGKHTFFTGEKAQAAGELAALAEELQEQQGEEPAAVSSTDRRAFLRGVAQELATRDVSDAAKSRARIHERHQKAKRRDKKERRGETGLGDVDDGIELASASGGEDSGDDGSDGAGFAGARAPSPSFSPERPPPSKRRRHAPEPEDRGVRERGGGSLDAGGGGDDPLGELERQALGRLGGTSLFS